MKVYLLIFSVFVTCLSCSIEDKKDEIEYVKVFILGYTDSVTDYNKGLSTDSYLQYDFKTDSVIHRTSVGANSIVFKMFTGKFNNDKYVDTIVNAMKFLKKHPEGKIPSRFDSTDDNFSGAVFYLEFKDKTGIHLYTFAVDTFNSLRDLEQFFFHMDELHWDKRPVNKTVIHFDSLAVKAAIKLGFYDKIEHPYVPLKCEPGISMTKIYGVWRSAGNEVNRKTKSTYSKMVFTEDGTYIEEKIQKDTSIFKFTAKFRLDQKRNLVILNKNGSLKKLKILKLTDDCLEFNFEGINSVFVYNRLK